MREETEQCHRPIAKIDSIADVRPESDEDGFTHINRYELYGMSF